MAELQYEWTKDQLLKRGNRVSGLSETGSTQDVGLIGKARGQVILHSANIVVSINE